METKKKKNFIARIPWKVWLLFIVLAGAIFFIGPNPDASGLLVHQVNPSSQAYELGLREGQKIVTINDISINSLNDFSEVTAPFEHDPVSASLGVNNDTVDITIIEELDLTLSEDLTVLRSKYPGIDRDAKINSVNGVEVSTIEEFDDELNKVLPQRSFTIVTDESVAAYFARGVPDFTVREESSSNIQKGLDLEGGTRVLVSPISDGPIPEEDLKELIQVLTNRLDVFGLSDVTIRSANDLDGKQFVLIEIAGLSRKDVENILESQGKFEARIGDDIVFRGGKEDIQFVCRNDGSCSGIHSCTNVGGAYQCAFQFSIRLSPDAAARHANITSTIPVVSGSNVYDSYLEKQIDFYLDDVLVSSLNIGSSLKGAAVQDISISGPGVGNTLSAAQASAEEEMHLLQSVLITGSLPYDIQIEKIDTISPSLGEEFLTNAIFVGVMAMLAVLVVIYIRYRSFKVVLPMALTMVSEVIIILGFAPLLKWSLDLVAIAGIIAAVGTGVDDQIVIADEILRKGNASVAWDKRLKYAFFIIFAAYATTVAAMIPLFRAGAGLIRGFAITTIIGVTIGVLITRPAYAAIVERWLKE